MQMATATTTHLHDRAADLAEAVAKEMEKVFGQDHQEMERDRHRLSPDFFLPYLAAAVGTNSNSG